MENDKIFIFYRKKMFAICTSKLGNDVKYCLFMNSDYIYYHNNEHKFILYDIKTRQK